MVLRIPYSRTPRGHVIIIILFRMHSAAKDYGNPNDRSANMKRGTAFRGGGEMEFYSFRQKNTETDRRI